MSTNTANNRRVLESYAQEIQTPLKELTPEQEQSLSNYVLTTYFKGMSEGTLGAAGKIGAERITSTYGAQYINRAISSLFNAIFRRHQPPASTWQNVKDTAWQGFGWLMSTGTQVTATPTALRAATFLSGLTGQVALPIAANLIYMIYNRVMSPEKMAKLENIAFDDLLTLHPDGTFHDPFGNTLDLIDAKDIFVACAKSAFVQQLLEVYDTLEGKKVEGEDKEKKVSPEIFKGAADRDFNQLLKDKYIIECDGKKFFANGEPLTENDQKIIHDAIERLKGKNPQAQTDEIHKFVDLIAEKSVLPLEKLTTGDISTLDKANSPKSMPFVFEAEDEWKNYIIRGSDGRYFLTQRFKGKPRGTIIPKEEIKGILEKAGELQRKQIKESEEKLESLLGDKSHHQELVARLNQLETSKLHDFLGHYFVAKYAKNLPDLPELEEDFKDFTAVKSYDVDVVFLNGQVLKGQKAEDFLQKLVGIPMLGSDDEQRIKSISELVEELRNNLPKNFHDAALTVIQTQDQEYIRRQDGKAITKEQAREIEKKAVERLEQSLELGMIEKSQEPVEKPLGERYTWNWLYPSYWSSGRSRAEAAPTSTATTTANPVGSAAPEHPDISKVEGLPSSKEIEEKKEKKEDF